MVSDADSQAASARFPLLLKWGVLALLVAILGLPINDLFAYAILVIAAVIVFGGTVTARMRPWLAAVLLGIVAVTGQHLLSPPGIEEGHNVFLPGGTDNVLLEGLPPEVYRLMAAEFDKQYPPDKRCTPSYPGCWRGNDFPDQVYAFSADGIYSNPEFSRKVDHIDFTDPVWLRLGFTNDKGYNWLAPGNDLPRLKRNRLIWMGWHRWQLIMPFFVVYKFPAAYVGSDLCWQGDVIWEDRTDQFTRLSNPLWACRTIEPADVGRRIFGMAIKPGSLAMSLEPSVRVHVAQATSTALAVFAIAATIGLLVRWRWRHVLLPATLIGLALVVIMIDDASFIGGFRPLDGGDDGLFYEGAGRKIVQHLLAGDFRAALMGGESVYYYGGPGLRYLRAFERFIFGDTNFGYLSLVLLLPIAVFALYRRFLSNRWALALALMFVAVPVGMIFGTTFFLYSRWAARGFADAAAAIFAICGVLYLVGRKSSGPGRGFASAFGSALLFALAVFVRPNIAPFIAVMLGGAGLAALSQREWRRLAGLCAGFLPILVMPLHNWYFGNVLVPFSANAALPQLFVTPPWVYGAAFIDLIRFDFAGDALARAATHIVNWLSGPTEWWLLVPLHALALALVVRVLTERRFDPWLRLIAAATLAQHAVALFYVTTPRYHLLAWFFTGLIGVVWLRNEGIAWLRGRFPQWWDRARLNRISREIERVMRRLEIVIGLTHFPRRKTARA